MERALVRTLVAVVAFGSLACGTSEKDGGGDEEGSLSTIAAQRCGLLFNCGCVDPGQQNLENQNQCRESLLDAYEYEADQAKAAGLEFDGACAAREEEWWSAVGCGWPTDEDLGSSSCALNCPLWHGDVGPGEACLEISNRATDCAQGLDCVGGFCEDICGNWRLAEGAKCYDPANPPTGTCVDGSYCDVGDTDRCQPIPRVGDPCPQGVCDADLWCNDYAVPEAKCETLKPTGAMCESDEGCVLGYCIGLVCAPLPTAGEDCYLECAGDLFCEYGVCTVPQSEGQSCASLPCGADLACVDGVCQQGFPWVCQGFY